MSRSVRSGRLLLTTALLAATTWVAPSHAGAIPGYAVLQANGTSTIDVTLKKPVVLDLFRMHIFSQGAYAGYYFEPLDKGVAPADGTGALLVDRLHPAGFYPLPVLLSRPDQEIDLYRPNARRTLAAGRYRVHVIGDRGVAVVLPVVSGSLPDLLATKRGSATVKGVDIDAPLADRGVVFGRVPAAVGDSLAFAALSVTYRGGSAPGDTAETCVEDGEGSACVLDKGTSRTSYGQSTDDRGEHWLHLSRYFPGDLVAATQTAAVEVAGVSPVTGVQLVLFRLPLTKR